MQQHECYTILRLFGIAPDKVKLSLRLAKAAGCQGLQLMESGGEYAVLIRCTGDTEQQARRDCQRWQNRLCGEFGDAVVGIDQQSLPQAAVQAAAAFVAECIRQTPEGADERLGVWLEAALPKLMPR